MKLKHFKLVAGSGKGKTPLLSFDNALQPAGISSYNLIKITSILPPYVKEEETIGLSPGEILYVAFASLVKEGEGLISAACAAALPENPSNIGVIMEYSGLCNEETARERATEMAQSAMKSRGIDIGEIKLSSVSLNSEGIHTVFAGCCLW